MFGVCTKCGNAKILSEPCPTCGEGPPAPQRAVAVADPPVAKPIMARPVLARPVTARPAVLAKPGEVSEPLDVEAMVAEINESIKAESYQHSLRDHAKTFFGIGGFILAFAVALAFQTLMFLRTAEPVTGIAAYPANWQSTNGSSRIVNVVRYTADGQTLETTASEREVGESVDLLVSTKDPRDARVNSFGVLWGWPIFLALVGGGLALMGGMWIASSKPRMQTY